MSASESQEKSAGAKEGDPELVEIFIDGEAHQVPKGKNLLEALLDVGEDVSFFCYYPGLSIAAKCRQCLVGIGDGHKLVPSCQISAQDGMRVRSKTEQVLEARRAQLAFTLVNHPLDCVICDKAGECALQRQYMDWDAEASFANHEKVHKPKKVDLGPDVVLDAERCIICGRCVRFTAEIAKSPQLLFSNRGSHTELTTAPGEKFDNAYSLNTVDICPVGALTDKHFRFKSRVWELWSTQSVCTGCSAGCGMDIHHKDGQIYRLVPPKKWDINENWMCNDGRKRFEAYDAMVRPTSVKVANADTSEEAGLDKIVSTLSRFAKDPETADQVAFVLGADVTNEDNWAAVQLAKDVFPGAKLYLAAMMNNDLGDDILRRNDPNPNRTGATAMGQDLGGIASAKAFGDALKAGDIKVAIVLGEALELPEDLSSNLGGLDLFLHLGAEISEISARATVLLPTAAWPEVDGTITNDANETKRLRAAFEPPGHARPAWDWLARIREGLGHPSEATTSKQIFDEIVSAVPAFADATWGPHIPTRQLRFGGRRG